MYGACALGAVIVLANLYTWGRVLTSLVLPPRTRLARSLKKDAPTLALRPEVQTLTDIVSFLIFFNNPIYKQRSNPVFFLHIDTSGKGRKSQLTKFTQ